MTWDPQSDRWLSLERAQRASGGDRAVMRRLGWGDEPSEHVLDRQRFGERRVEVHWHPLKWAEKHRDLDPVVDHFQLVEPKGISDRQYRMGSFFEIECLATMNFAYQAECERRLKRAAKEAGVRSTENG